MSFCSFFCCFCIKVLREIKKRRRSQVQCGEFGNGHWTTCQFGLTKSLLQQKKLRIPDNLRVTTRFRSIYCTVIYKNEIIASFLAQCTKVYSVPNESPVDQTKKRRRVFRIHFKALPLLPLEAKLENLKTDGCFLLRGQNYARLHLNV